MTPQSRTKVRGHKRDLHSTDYTGRQWYPNEYQMGVRKQIFIDRMLDENYAENDIREFADEYYQNLSPVDENIRNFKAWQGTRVEFPDKSAKKSMLARLKHKKKPKG